MHTSFGKYSLNGEFVYKKACIEKGFYLTDLLLSINQDLRKKKKNQWNLFILC